MINDKDELILNGKVVLPLKDNNPLTLAERKRMSQSSRPVKVTLTDIGNNALSAMSEMNKSLLKHILLPT